MGLEQRRHVHCVEFFLFAQTGHGADVGDGFDGHLGRLLQALFLHGVLAHDDLGLHVRGDQQQWYEHARNQTQFPLVVKGQSQGNQ